MTTYPAITLWQPWATLVAEGAKRYEFRGWEAPRRLWGKRVAIHAGARSVSRDELRGLVLKLHSSFWRETGLERAAALAVLEPLLLRPNSIPRMAVVCLATLGQPIRDSAPEAALGVYHVNDSERDEHSNWGWPLTDIQRLEPYIPARGAQGWWNWNADSACAGAAP